MNGYWRHAYLRLIIIIIRNDNIAIECRNFLSDFLLQTNTSSHRYNHHDHSNRNGGNGNFYNWSRYTTFTPFSRNESLGYKIF